MKKSIILSAVMLGIISTSVMAEVVTTEREVIVDPITGVAEGTATVVSGVANTTLGILPVFAPTRYNTTDRYYYKKAPARFSREEVFTNINNGHEYVVTSDSQHAKKILIQSQSQKPTKYMITNMSTGKKYQLIGVKEGSMDVMRGDRVIRYETITPIVKSL